MHSIAWRRNTPAAANKRGSQLIYSAPVELCAPVVIRRLPVAVRWTAVKSRRLRSDASRDELDEFWAEAFLQIEKLFCCSQQESFWRERSLTYLKAPVSYRRSVIGSRHTAAASHWLVSAQWRPNDRTAIKRRFRHLDHNKLHLSNAWPLNLMVLTRFVPIVVPINVPIVSQQISWNQLTNKLRFWPINILAKRQQLFFLLDSRGLALWIQNSC